MLSFSGIVSSTHINNFSPYNFNWFVSKQIVNAVLQIIIIQYLNYFLQVIAFYPFYVAS